MGDGQDWSWGGEEQQRPHPPSPNFDHFRINVNQGFYFDPNLVRIEEDDRPRTALPNPNSVLPNEAPRFNLPPNVPNPSKKPRLVKRTYAIDSIHLSFLVAAYHQHFNNYSSIRKKASEQLIPAIVWKGVYVDYCKEFPLSTFQEESLKVKLRETLKELKTGTSNQDNPENAVLQPIDFLEAIKITKGHAKRNTLNLRAGIVEHMSPNRATSDTSAVKETSATTSAGGPSTGEKEKERPKSKGEILAETAQGITSLASTYAGGEANRNELIGLKMESEKKRCRMFSTKDRSMRMNDLIKLRDEGFYTPEQFRTKMQDILDST